VVSSNLTKTLRFHHDLNAKSVRVSGSVVNEFFPAIGLGHVRRLCDDTGILEHAEGAVGRREHGYCTDDVARQLLVASLYGDDAAAQSIAEQGLQYLRHACLPTGEFRSRMSYARLWQDSGASDDASGRALWGLGVAAQNAPWAHVRRGALAIFDRTSIFRSEFWHATAFSVLGASAIVDCSPENVGAKELLVAAGRSLPTMPRDSSWKWHETQLTYASPLLADALLALSSVDTKRTAEGLDLLLWLSSVFVLNGRLSAMPTGGLCESDARPGFDQQPIEAQAFASAAWRAWMLTNDSFWLELVVISAAWFFGHNDSSVPLVDRETHGCCDGLQRDGRNENQGAESTLAMLHVMAILDRAVASGCVLLPSEPKCLPEQQHGS
jgi:hypothetical protein